MMMLCSVNTGRVRQNCILLSLFLLSVTRLQGNLLLHKDH